jgi:tetratricopeptide (TPR) repeat protein
MVNKIWSVLFALAVGVITLPGCEFMAVHTAPEKRASTNRLPSAEKADALFWNTLHAGDYAKIEESLNSLTAAYLANPADATTAAHIGWLHIWRLSERARLAPAPPSITNEAILARRYFQEAVALNPEDARFLGFLGSATLSEGSIHKDEKVIRHGYYLLRDGIKAWPEFNLFTAGYTMSAMPVDSARFKEGLEWQWANLALCAGEDIDRNTPVFQKYMALETTIGKKRVCWNSWIAPHNFEGFFMNLGDMLVKAGNWQTAQAVYANARLSKTYASWPYKDELENRITSASENVERFRKPDQALQSGQKLMVNSRYACMACHQN